MNLAGQLRPIVAALAVWAATVVRRACRGGQRLSDLGACRIRLWLHEGQWREPAVDRAMFLLDRRGGLDRVL